MFHTRVGTFLISYTLQSLFPPRITALSSTWRQFTSNALPKAWQWTQGPQEYSYYSTVQNRLYCRQQH